MLIKYTLLKILLKLKNIFIEMSKKSNLYCFCAFTIRFGILHREISKKVPSYFHTNKTVSENHM